MMDREDFVEVEKQLMAEIVKRRQLGGYSADASTLLFLVETVYRLTQHVASQTPRRSK